MHKPALERCEGTRGVYGELASPVRVALRGRPVSITLIAQGGAASEGHPYRTASNRSLVKSLLSPLVLGEYKIEGAVSND